MHDESTFSLTMPRFCVTATLWKSSPRVSHCRTVQRDRSYIRRGRRQRCHYTLSPLLSLPLHRLFFTLCIPILHHYYQSLYESCQGFNAIIRFIHSGSSHTPHSHSLHHYILFPGFCFLVLHRYCYYCHHHLTALTHSYTHHICFIHSCNFDTLHTLQFLHLHLSPLLLPYNH